MSTPRDFNNSPLISVGIISAPRLHITLHGGFIDRHGNHLPHGHSITIDCSDTHDLPCLYQPNTPDAYFTIHDVTIGIDFHWQQLQNQSFHGALRIEPGHSDARHIIAINEIPAEQYLCSVISSEMKATAPLEFLKAHAVISRSWLRAQQFRPSHLQPHHSTTKDTPEERIKWYNATRHTQFLVCADDHCQRYQGISNAFHPDVVEAVSSTFGLVLRHNDEYCDTRFAKCCGGVTERFSSCWEDVDTPYLSPVADPYCSRAKEHMLHAILNDYDLATRHYLSWRTVYTAPQLRNILLQRTGIDFGIVKSITPLRRGDSGRIITLRIEGTLRSMVIGKELEIRRSLSPSHLYSSNFTAHGLKTPGNKTGLPDVWIIDGRGWGHGVGMCQIGAAVMAYEGFSFRQILAHYYPGAELSSDY